jgi:cobalt-zinc-cadmium efflux system outer membrane protein
LKNELLAMKYVLCVSALWWMTGAVAQVPSHQDWTLSAVLQRVGEVNRDVQAARRSLDAARADETGAAVTPPPQFSVLSQSIDPHNLGHGPLWSRPVDTIFRIDKTLERGSKADLRIRQANAGRAAAEQDLLDKQRAQRVAAAQAYWDLKLAQEQLAVSQHNWELAQDSSRAAQLRQAQGDLSRLEATRLAVEADRAANERTQVSLQVSQAQSALAQTLAMSAAAASSMQATDPWPVAQIASADVTDEAWLGSRPEVKSAMQRAAQAQAALDLAQAQRKTDVTVSVQFEHNPEVASRLWGVGLAFPLGMDGRQDGPVTHALVAVADAQAELDKVREAALAERAQQGMALSTATERLHRLEQQLLPQAREALKAAEFARQQGALALQDVLDARRALHAAELDVASAHADQAKAWTALSMAPDLNAIAP